MAHDPPRHAAAPVAVVAEDEPLYRLQTVDLLGDAGFEVLDVCDAAAALALFEQREAVAVLFTDVRMPGPMNGLGLAHEVARRWPGTRILVCSAMPGIEIGALPAEAVFFEKPYIPEKLLEAAGKAAA